MSGARPTRPLSTEDLFRNHAQFVSRLLSRLGVGQGELDDAVQEVFLVVHRNGGYLPGPATPTGYLASIALRAAAAHRRRARKSRDRHADGVAPDDTRAATSDPAKSLEVRESLDEVEDALEQLKPDLRATLVLAEIEGESCTTIARSMQVPVGTVYWRLHQARKTFRVAVQSRRAQSEGNRPSSWGLRAGAFLFGVGSTRADEFLRAMRDRPVGHFDVAAGLERLRAALRAETSAPGWAAAAAAATKAVAGSVSAGIALPAMLSGVAVVCAVALGLPHWRAASAAPSAPASVPPLAGIADSPAHAGGLANTAAAQPAARGEVSTKGTDSSSPGSAVTVSGTPPASLGVAYGASLASTGVSARPAAGTASAPHPARAIAPATEAPATLAGDSPAPREDRLEIEDVATAERLLASDPQRALAMARAGEARFAGGYLREERRYVGIAALLQLGRIDEAGAEADAFARDYPSGPFAPRVRAALARAQAR